MLPNDPYMLLSFINTQLRDKYSSLDALCDDYDISADEILSKLESSGYIYNKELNKFICK